MAINPNRWANLADDAQMIQAAVDEAAKTGQTVVIPARNERTGEKMWVLERAVKLHSGSAVCLENAHLRLADGAVDSLFKNDTARTGQAARPENRQHDICLFGVGSAVLDGGRHNGVIERNEAQTGHRALENTLVHFQNVERVRVENLRLVNARYWGMTFHFCSNGHVSGIDFMSSGNCPNCDGIDLREGCFDFLVEHITGYTQDDTIALTALADQSILPVEGMDPSIHNVVIRDVSACSLCAVVRLLNQDGRKLYNVVIENVQTSVEIDPAAPGAQTYPLRLPDAERGPWAVEPVYWRTFENRSRRPEACVRIGENGYYNPDMPDARSRLGDTFNITVRNVQACAQFGVTLSCTLCDSLIDGVQMFGDSAAAVYVGKGEFEDVRFRNLGFARNAVRRAEDWTAHDWDYGYDMPCAAIFGGAKARGLDFDGLTVHPSGQDAFGGYGDVEMSARNVRLRGEGSQLLRGEGIRVNAAGER